VYCDIFCIRVSLPPPRLKLTVIAGIGLEILVWIRFLQTWGRDKIGRGDAAREFCCHSSSLDSGNLDSLKQHATFAWQFPWHLDTSQCRHIGLVHPPFRNIAFDATNFERTLDSCCAALVCTFDVFELALVAVLANLSHLHSTHWLHSLCTSVVLVAHWMYLVAGGLHLLVVSGSSSSENVHTEPRLRSTNTHHKLQITKLDPY